MADELDAFLADLGSRPWVWGENDCSMILSDWAARCGHLNGGSPFVGRYSDRVGCESIVRSNGGLLQIVSAQAAALGLTPVEEPYRGVIAVIGSARNGLRQWGAIHDGKRWMVRVTEGFAPMTAPVLGMWSV